MRNQFVLWVSSIFATLAMAGCAADDQAPDEPAGDKVVQVQSALGLPLPFGTLYEYGMKVEFIQVPTTLADPLAVTALTACEPQVLYAVMPETEPPFSPFALYFSSDGGQTFTRSLISGTANDKAVALSAEIACDDGRLFTIGKENGIGPNRIFFAGRSNGNIGAWTLSAAMPSVDHIQGSDGTIYGIQDVGTLHPLYKANTHIGAGDISWTFVSNVGSKYVSGGGSSNVSDKLAWPRRAFSTAPDRTAAFNDTLLDGQNTWRFFDTGDERFNVLTAGATNLLYGICPTQAPGLVTIKLTEDDCTNGIDDDADGRVDSEDPACAAKAAATFCALSSTLSGTYCVNRYQPKTFLAQVNQNAGLVTCSSTHKVVPLGASPTPGVCIRVNTRSDRLMTPAELSGSDPAGTGRWCNMMWPQNYATPSLRNEWDFAWGGAGSDPCATIRNRHPGNASGLVTVRAGLYSTTGNNAVLASCLNGGFSMAGAGNTAPLQAVFDAVRPGPPNNGCIFTVSPTAMPVWSKPFPLIQEPAGAAGYLNHTFSPVEVAQFGHGETGMQSGIDRDGIKHDDVREHAYDISLNEGTPLYAMRNGTIPDLGSRDRDVSGNGCQTSYQGEIYVRNVIGSNPDYQESFVAFYAHTRRSLVVPRQSVKAGQLIGFSGRNGCSSGPHLHLHTFRERNVNAHKVGVPEFGYKADLIIDPLGSSVGNNFFNLTAIDPTGWRNQVAFDPSAYLDRNSPPPAPNPNTFQGLGGWSVDLFIAGQRPHL